MMKMPLKEALLARSPEDSSNGGWAQPAQASRDGENREAVAISREEAKAGRVRQHKSPLLPSEHPRRDGWHQVPEAR